METIGQFIREKRNARGLSLRRLALQAGITPPFLSDIERGRRFPSEKSRAKLAPLLGVEKGDLDLFDFRKDIPAMIELLQTYPDIQAAFRATMQRIREGTLAPGEFAKLLSEASARGKGTAGTAAT